MCPGRGRVQDSKVSLNCRVRSGKGQEVRLYSGHAGSQGPVTSSVEAAAQGSPSVTNSRPGNHKVLESLQKLSIAPQVPSSPHGSRESTGEAEAWFAPH